MYTNVSRYPGINFTNDINPTSIRASERLTLPSTDFPKLDVAGMWYSPVNESVEYSPDGISKRVLQFAP